MPIRRYTANPFVLFYCHDPRPRLSPAPAAGCQQSLGYSLGCRPGQGPLARTLLCFHFVLKKKVLRFLSFHNSWYLHYHYLPVGIRGWCLAPLKRQGTFSLQILHIYISFEHYRPKTCSKYTFLNTKDSSVTAFLPSIPTTISS